jgi:hypothetical protein
MPGRFSAQGLPVCRAVGDNKCASRDISKSKDLRQSGYVGLA